MGKGGETILNSTVLTLYSLEQEVGHVAKNSYDQGREHLNDLEIEHLLKMTKHVVMKIKTQLMENAQ
jgi:hypothetical protein